MAYAEQGLGDAMQLARYLPMLREYCDDMLVLVHGSLVGLFGRQACGRWELAPIDPEAHAPPHDAWISFMSMPFHFKTTLGTVPSPAEFHVKRAPVARRVALCTQGGKVASLDLDRSDHTGSLASLMRDDRFEWVDFTGRRGDWLDTAQDLAACDLLISVDSALAHLAGSLGVETWLVPPCHFEWRWTAGRDDSVWYPATHRLFRRKRTNDWPGVTARIKAALAERYA